MQSVSSKEDFVFVLERSLSENWNYCSMESFSEGDKIEKVRYI